MNIEKFDLSKINLTKYLFFTGKGGTGKTSTACSIAVNLADKNKKILLVSTDPASNLQDVFDTQLSNKPKQINGMKNLEVINLDPISSAKEYKDSVIKPYINVLPDEAIKNMEEQLSGSCTVEIAAFNEFSNMLTNIEINEKYDYIIFDTAPTGHTLRMLSLPAAWTEFIDTNKFGASCLGQLSGLGDKKEMYHNAVEVLKCKTKTTLFLITRPEITPLKEVERTSNELKHIGMNNQLVIVNGVLESPDDEISIAVYNKQQLALSNIPISIKNLKMFYIPLRSYNLTGIDNIRNLIIKDEYTNDYESLDTSNIKGLKTVIDDIQDKKVIFTMGKGGVGKTTIASAIAVTLAKRGKHVVLATTDPADHLKYTVEKINNLNIVKIDEKYEVEQYKQEVINEAIKNGIQNEDLDYIKEDLRSPCTEEVALFKAFAKIVAMAKDSIVVIDTAPTGHTLLLLDTTENYSREIAKSTGVVPQEVLDLLPRLKNQNETQVIIVTLAETTPVFESLRLMEDLKRAQINNKWWVINSSMAMTNTTNTVLKNRASNEIKWINKVKEISNNNFAVVQWKKDNITFDKLNDIVK